ncbi:MAG: energy transducer TonB [Sulfitobacter sp.]
MQIGHYISGTGHLVFIGWLLFGSVFDPDPPPFEMTEVSVISGADFDHLIASQRSPDTSTDVAQPAQPEVTADVPEVAVIPDAVIEQPTPIQTETPPDDTPPEVTEQALPPETQVEETPPELDQPVGDVAVLVPDVAPQAVPRPVERVAPEPVAQPEPDATPDPVEQQAVAPDAAGEAIEEPQEAQAPEEATTQIVTEATAAPKASPRPPGKRPTAPAPQVAETPAPSETPAPAATTDTDAVAEALAEALGGVDTPVPNPAAAAPSGPPLSAGEKESLRVAVAACWNVGSLSSAALQTTVVISVNMNQNGTPVIETIRQVGSSGGSDADAKRVFDSARRAIILCGSKGYKLPSEKFGQWQTIEMTFDPKKMGRK